MQGKNTRRIDFSRKRIADIADKYYNQGDYLSALRLAYKELNEYGLDFEVTARLTDVYEAMGLHGSAINCWFRYLDVAAEAELPDIYEGLAVCFLAIGNEGQSAFYYNRLIDADDSLPEETKLDIIDAFSKDKRDNFRFVYPPELADYSQELDVGTKALKDGNFRRAIAEFSKVIKGSKDYVEAKESQAVAYLLAGETDKAEALCVELLQEYPDEVRVLATLAAVYVEQGRKEESLAIAKKLVALEQTDTDDLYKVATVCCENDMHAEAYEKFSQMEKKLPFDGRMLYFRAVAAFKCGKTLEAEKTLDTLCSVYPDAEVAKYYLKALRAYRENKEDGVLDADNPMPEFTYFYQLPHEEREERLNALLRVNSCTKDEAKMFGLLVLHDGYLHWCFDEMDGAERDLQYLSILTANHVRADEFIKEVLLDFEVADVLKLETLRMLAERNEKMEVGLVLCSVYRRVYLQGIKIGRKRRKKFLQAYAKVFAKIILINEMAGNRLRMEAENLYHGLEQNDAFDMLENTDDCACAIYLMSDLKVLGTDLKRIADIFGANLPKAQALAIYGLSYRFGISTDELKQELEQEKKQ